MAFHTIRQNPQAIKKFNHKYETTNLKLNTKNHLNQKTTSKQKIVTTLNTDTSPISLIHRGLLQKRTSKITNKWWRISTDIRSKGNKNGSSTQDLHCDSHEQNAI